MTPSIVAWRPPGITPLEIWNAAIDGSTLFERRSDAGFFEALGRAIMVAVPRESWRAAALVGGGVERARATDAFARAGHAIAILDDDPFFTASGARVALGDETVVVDVGQTSLKASSATGTLRMARKPAFSDASSLATTVGRCVRMVHGSSACETLVVAVPCALEGDGARLSLGPSSYPLEGDPRPFVDTVVRAAEIEPREVRIVNDAVLAAWVVERRIGASGGSDPLLVLTVGHGVGAATIAGRSTAGLSP